MNIEKIKLELKDAILRIDNRAVKDAQKESLKKGVPNVYTRPLHNKQIHSFL